MMFKSFLLYLAIVFHLSSNAQEANTLYSFNYPPYTNESFNGPMDKVLLDLSQKFTPKLVIQKFPPTRSVKTFLEDSSLSILFGAEDILSKKEMSKLYFIPFFDISVRVIERKKKLEESIIAADRASVVEVDYAKSRNIPVILYNSVLQAKKLVTGDRVNFVTCIDLACEEILKGNPGYKLSDKIIYSTKAGLFIRKNVKGAKEFYENSKRAFEKYSKSEKYLSNIPKK